MTPIHVLVAGGEPALRRSLALLLESQGMRVAVVDDVSEALEYVAKSPPDVALVCGQSHDPTRGMLADLARFPYTEAKRRLLSLFDETYTAEILRGTGGNLSEAARRAGLDRSNFRRLLRRHKDEP